MRDLKRNKQKIWVALLTRTAEADEWGNTQDSKTYGEPIQVELSISGNRGEASSQAFGQDLQYDREMVTSNMACPIDEYSRLWLDGRSPAETHNYIVKAVSRTLNAIRYAIEKVNVS